LALARELHLRNTLDKKILADPLTMVLDERRTSHAQN